MPTYRVQTSLQDVSGLARDQYVNTFHVTSAATILPTELDALVTEVAGYYVGLQPNLSTALANTGHTVKVYHVGAALGSPPLIVHPFTCAAPGGTLPLPNEVACCATFHADPQPGVARQSWRGRFYVGPFNTATLGSGTGGGRPLLAFRTDLRDRTATMLSNINGMGTLSPVIYSRKNALVYPIKRVSVDDAWDTQRSRGLRATTAPSVDITGGGGPSGPVG